MKVWVYFNHNALFCMSVAHPMHQVIRKKNPCYYSIVPLHASNSLYWKWRGKKTNMCRQALSHYNHFITRIDLPAQNTDPANPRLGLWKQSARVTEGRFWQVKYWDTSSGCSSCLQLAALQSSGLQLIGFEWTNSQETKLLRYFRVTFF